MLLGYDPLGKWPTQISDTTSRAPKLTCNHPDDDIRGQIWDNTFRKLAEEHELGIRDMKYDYDAKNYVKNAPEVKELKWNGREIRNGNTTHIHVVRKTAYSRTHG